MLKYATTIAVGLMLGLAAASHDAHAQDPSGIIWEEQHGVWGAWAIVNHDGSPACGVDTYFTDGRMIYMKVYEFGITEFYLSDDGWNLEQGRTGKITVELGRYRRTFEAEASAPDELYFLVPDFDFLEAFMRAWTMRVEFPRARPWEVSLDGTARAVDRMILCYQEYVQPFEQRQDERSTDPLGGGGGGGNSPI